MYQCTNCGQMFDSPKEVTDFYSEYWGTPARHTTTVCPYCESDEFDEMDKCEICGEYIAPGEELCENCRELIHDIGDDIRGKARYITLLHKLDYDAFIEHLVNDLDK